MKININVLRKYFEEIGGYFELFFNSGIKYGLVLCVLFVCIGEWCKIREKLLNGIFCCGKERVFCIEDLFLEFFFYWKIKDVDK